jgi:hypothetical protein
MITIFLSFLGLRCGRKASDRQQQTYKIFVSRNFVDLALNSINLKKKITVRQEKHIFLQILRTQGHQFGLKEYEIQNISFLVFMVYGLCQADLNGLIEMLKPSKPLIFLLYRQISSGETKQMPFKVSFVL